MPSSNLVEIVVEVGVGAEVGIEVGVEIEVMVGVEVDAAFTGGWVVWRSLVEVEAEAKLGNSTWMQFRCNLDAELLKLK